MRKKLSLSIGLVIALFVVLVIPAVVAANHRQEVLGESVSPSELSIPPTAEGPGLILPDSPMFFLDELKQNFRLFLAFSQESKAKIHTAIAGERLAELQFMLSKNNDHGIRVALQGLSDNLKKAAGSLSNAKLKGKDVKLLAKTINDSIKDKQDKLLSLEKDATGELKALAQAAKEGLMSAKVEVEDSLPDEFLLQEIEDDLDMEVKDNIEKATTSAKGLSRAIDVLTRLASEAASREQTQRRAALMRAIEVKNDALQRQEERALEKVEEKNQRLLEAKKKATSEALKVQEAAAELEKARAEFDSL